MRRAWLLEREVRKCKGSVISADGVANGNDPASAFMRTILDGAAAYEREMIRSRTKAALMAKAKRGELIGQVPYGYSASSDGHLVRNSQEQAVLTEIRELRAAGMSLRAIVAELSKRGFVSRVGKPFALTQVARMVKNELKRKTMV